MLRISIFDEPYSTTLKVEGKLASDWASEAQRIWSSIASRPEPKKKIIDLFGVTFVDDCGRQLLVDMHAAGAQLTGSGPMISALIDEIQGPAKNSSGGRFKKFMFSLLALLALIAVTAGRSFGQQTGAPLLRLQDAIDLAKVHNRQLKIQQLDAASAKDDVAIAKARRLPSFKTDIYGSGLLAPISFEFDRGAFGTFKDIGPVPDTKTKVTAERSFNVAVVGQLQQPLTQLYRLNLGVRAREIGAQIAAEEARQTEQEMVRDVRRAYFAIVQARSAAVTNHVSVASLMELQRVLADRVQLQAALPADEMDVRVALANARQQQTSLDNSLTSQKEQLNLLLGRSPETDFDVEDVLELEPSEVDLAMARAQAVARRPDLRASELRVQQADLDRRAKKAERLPDVGGFANYFSPFNVDVVPKNIAAAGIQVTWEPWDWGRKKHELSQKQIALDKARLAADQTRDSIQAEVGRAHRSLQERQASAEVAKLNVDAVRERLREVTDQFQQKAALLKDVLDVQSKLADAQHHHTEAMLAFWNAKAEFARTIGEE
jgi:outer membrane protein TolC/anti-anti-sigma regulatory factor